MGINRTMLNLANSIAANHFPRFPPPRAVPRVISLFVLCLDPSIFFRFQHPTRPTTCLKPPLLCLFAISGEPKRHPQAKVHQCCRAVSYYFSHHLLGYNHYSIYTNIYIMKFATALSIVLVGTVAAFAPSSPQVSRSSSSSPSVRDECERDSSNVDGIYLV